ncbi:hypothetical protein RJ641_024253 [Dillenia turbinata]|uniref:Uncharacterized protein n=1 Tax=Dillenia turbinata TaxID=194707 RepID=A0AAN8UAZ2_9MAGN
MKRWSLPSLKSPEVKSFSQQFSSSTAGIPIKKRRVITCGTFLPIANVESTGTVLSSGTKESSLEKRRDRSDAESNTNVVQSNVELSEQGEDIANDKHDSIDTTIESSQPPTDRCNWDLNEPMDAWEGSTGDELIGRGTGVDGVNRSCVLRDIKPFIRLSKVIGPGILFPYALVHLAFHAILVRNYLVCQRKLIQEKPPVISALLSKSVLPRYLHLMGYRSIKPEPFDESLKQYLKQPTADIGGGLDCGTAKHQLVEKPMLESLQKSDIRTFKLVEGRPLKSESVHDGNEELIKQANGTKNVEIRKNKSIEGSIVLILLRFLSVFKVMVSIAREIGSWGV